MPGCACVGGTPEEHSDGCPNGLYSHPEMTAGQLTLGRVQAIRDMCLATIEHERTYPNYREGAMTDRHWLAQGVLNILNGNIDDQIRAEFPTSSGRHDE